MILAVVAFGAAAVYFCVFCYHGASGWKTLAKTLAILPVVVFAAVLGGREVLVAALAFCLLGDVLLSLEGEHSFLGGVAAFATGHVLYIWLFLTHAGADPSLIFQMPFVLIVVVLLAVAIFVTPILFKGAGELRFAVLAYVPMIVGMGMASLGFAQSGPLVLVTVGGLLFVASDLVLGLEMFALKSGTWAAKLAPFWVWATYWVAQLCIVVGFA